MSLSLLADEVQTAAAAWVFSQPAGIAVAVLAAGVAFYGLYWFANLHAVTVTTATADMKSSMATMAEAFTRDQERDREIFIREQEKNRDLVKAVMEHHERQNRA
jgi:hypothetical protein